MLKAGTDPSMEVLKENEERLRLGLEAGSIAGVWDWNIATGQVIWSPQLEKMHGLTPGTFHGTFDEVVKVVHPDDRDSFRNSIQQTLEKKQMHHVEYRVIRPDGTISWLLGKGRLYTDETGQPVRMLGLAIDITERREAEEALRESNMKFQSLVESASDAIILADSSGTILSCNRSTEKILGYGQEIIGKPLTVLMPERYREAHHQAIEKLSETGESRLIGKTVEFYGLRKDGSEFPLELSLSHWKIGDKSYYSGTIRDTTRRKMVEKALQKKTLLVQLLRDIAVASNEAVAIDPAIRFAVDRICEYTGWPVGHVYFISNDANRQLLSSQIWHLSEPERYESFKKLTDITEIPRGAGLVGSVLEKGEAIWMSDLENHPKFLRKEALKDNGLQSGLAFPIQVNSQVVAILEFFTPDTTEMDEELLDATRHIGSLIGRVFERQWALEILTQAELRYREIVESVQAIVWRAHPQTLQFSFVSKEAEDILGYSVHEWLDKPDFWINHIHPEDRDWVIAYCKRSALEKKLYDFEYRMIAKDEKVVWLRAIVRVIAEGETPKYLIGIMIDVTPQKDSENQLQRSRERLRALSAHLQFVREEERIKIAREIHDELGQVLTALRMDLALLNQGLLESSESMPRQKLMEEIGSMCRLVDRTIQTVRRIVTELRPEVLDHLDLKAAIEWQAQEFQGRSGVTCELNSNIKALDLDRDKATALFRIFQETITNVARHSGATHVRIRLEETGDHLVLEVKDNGRGITEAEISNAKSFGLLGIKERALLLGGEVEIDGAPEQGTTITVRVPFAKVGAEQ
jgi:PAS domain S-box-containing protein